MEQADGRGADDAERSRDGDMVTYSNDQPHEDITEIKAAVNGIRSELDDEKSRIRDLEEKGREHTRILKGDPSTQVPGLIAQAHATQRIISEWKKTREAIDRGIRTFKWGAALLVSIGVPLLIWWLSNMPTA